MPGVYDEQQPKPIGNTYYIKYRPVGDDQWETEHPIADNFTVKLDQLTPGTKYEVVAVSVMHDEEGGQIGDKETESSAHVISTTGLGNLVHM
jgi:hypothetical protein